MAAFGGRGSLNPVSGELLRDGHGRVIGDLRVSVTDRCNFRCQYCMPAEGLPWLERAEILRFEEIARLAGHNQTATTELVYRHELRPVITTGAEVMDRILSRGSMRVR